MSGDVRDRAGFIFQAGKEINGYFFPITLVLDLLYTRKSIHRSKEKKHCSWHTISFTGRAAIFSIIFDLSAYSFYL